MNDDHWHALGSAQYRKWQVYDMQWHLRSDELGTALALENYYACGAPFGGPIALFLDPRRNATATLAADSANPIMKLTIFTSSGNKIVDIDWQDRLIIGMGWTDQEHLVTVTENGKKR